jgi:UDP:flavonoid glycosyltransferase YjiC (YdhE family)
MKIALTSIGSRGDIQPYIALGKALQENGYDVSVFTHPWAKDLLHSYKLKHIPMGNDIDIHATAKRFVENSSGNIKGMLFALNFIFAQMRECHADLLEEIKDVDLVIGHGIVGSSEADILKKPYVSVSIETIGLQKQYWRSKNYLREFGVYTADKLKGLLFGGPYKKFRKEIGAPPIDTKKEYPHLALVPISPQIQKPNCYWKPITEITGFFLADTPDAFVPPKGLEDFIKAGEKPLFISFGSMFHTKQQTFELYQLIVDAIAKSNSRAVLLMADLTINDVDIPEYIFPVKHVPYRWLLPHVSMVIHHFGFGTTAEVLHAGLPSIPIPHIFDQSIRANQIYKLGLAHKPLNLKTLTSQKLTSAIQSVKANVELKSNCCAIGDKIVKENGLAKAVELINKFFV